MLSKIYTGIQPRKERNKQSDTVFPAIKENC